MRRGAWAIAALSAATFTTQAQDAGHSALQTNRPWEQSAAGESQADEQRRAKLIGRRFWVNPDDGFASTLGPFAVSPKFNADRHAQDMQIDQLQSFSVVGERVNKSLGYPLAKDAWMECRFDDGSTLFLSQQSFERRMALGIEDRGAIMARNPADDRADAERAARKQAAAEAAMGEAARKRMQARQAALEKLPAPAIGMTLGEVLRSRWGAPASHVKTTTANGESLMLIYGRGRVFLVGGKVTMIQEQ